MFLFIVPYFRKGCKGIIFPSFIFFDLGPLGVCGGCPPYSRSIEESVKWEESPEILPPDILFLGRGFPFFRLAGLYEVFLELLL